MFSPNLNGTDYEEPCLPSASVRIEMEQTIGEKLGKSVFSPSLSVTGTDLKGISQNNRLGFCR